MHYRIMPEDSYLDFEMDEDICTDCPYRESQEEEFDPTMVRQRRRRRRRHPYYYHRPPFYPYYPPYRPPYHPPYHPYPRGEYDED